MNDPADRQTILAVDDTPGNLDLLGEVLRPLYKVRVATDGEKALQLCAGSKPDMILLDIMMPGMDGYEVCRRLKANPATAMIPVIFITAMSQDEDEARGLALGAVDYITKPISPPIVLARVKTQLALYDQNRELAARVRARTAELEATRLEVIRRLGRAAEFRDNETGLHVIRMSHYARLLAEALVEGANEWTELIFCAAPMHDIGKIGIPDRVLLKPGKLNDEEWALMRRHPGFGAEIIGRHDSPLLQLSREIALSHHEKWDGSGYPGALAGKEIPLSGRLVALADVFDALTTARPYKPAWSVEDAVRLIEEGAGSHFDPALVDLFDQVLPAILAVKARHEEPTVGARSATDGRGSP